MSIVPVVSALLLVADLYVVCGVIFSVFFFLKWFNKIDEGTQGSTWKFKLIITPGTIVFWPFLLSRVRSSKNSAS